MTYQPLQRMFRQHLNPLPDGFKCTRAGGRKFGITLRPIFTPIVRPQLLARHLATGELLNGAAVFSRGGFLTVDHLRHEGRRHINELG